jgi:predicted ATPase
MTCPILVERDLQLDVLSRQSQQLQHGNGHIVFIVGEAGNGKTRLIDSFITHLKNHRPFSSYI